MSNRDRRFVSTMVKDWGKSPLARIPDTSVIPTTLSPDLWLDAADTSTIVHSSGSVSQWNNKGTKGNFTQATGALQPATGSNTINGMNVLTFGADYLTATNSNEWTFLHDGTKYLFAAVFRGTSAVNMGILGNEGNDTNAVGFTSICYLNSTDRFLGHVVRRGVDFNQTVLNTTATSSISTNTNYLKTLLADPSNAVGADRSSIFINTGTATKGNTQTNAVSTANPTYSLQVGSRGNGNSPFTGYLAEIVIVSGANATEANRVALRDYLNSKWAVY